MDVINQAGRNTRTHRKAVIAQLPLAFNKVGSTNSSDMESLIVKQGMMQESLKRKTRLV